MRAEPQTRESMQMMMKKKTIAQRRMALCFFASMTAVALSACGGGGGDGASDSAPQDAGSTSVTLSASNYVGAAQQMVSSSSYVLNGASLLTGAQTTDAQAVMRLGVDQALRMNHWFSSNAQTPVTLVGATQTETESCSGGGSISGTITDGNGNGNLDVGDGVSLQASNCIEDGLTMNGGLQMSISSLTGTFGSSSYNAGMTLTYANFAVGLGGGDTVTGNGQMTLAIGATNGNATSLTIDVPNFSASGKLGGVSYTQQLAAYHMSVGMTYSGGVSTTTSSISGGLSSSALDGKKITIETPVAFVQASNQAAPSKGQMIAHGANNSQVRLTVQAGGMVLIELDADGNGLFETSTTQSWSSLI